MRDDSITLTRSDIGQFASVAFALFALIAALSYFYEGTLRPYTMILIALAALSLIAWALITPSEFVGFFTGRQARRGTVAVFSSVLVVGIISMAYLYVERQVITFDLTETREFTLSDSTRRIVERLPRDLRIIGFYSAENIAVREMDDQFWRQYEVLSDGRIQRIFIDPVEQPAVAETFGAQDGDIFIAFVDDDGELIPQSISYVPMIDKHERDMSLAINRLLQQGSFAAFFDISHGQRSLRDTSSSGLSIAGELLGLNGWRVVEFDLRDLVANDQPIPDEASVVILSRPRQPFAPATIDALDDYLQRGGSLFIMADPVFADTGFLLADSAFNAYLWESWGIRALDAVVVELMPGLDNPSPLDVVSIQIFDSPITANVNLPDEPDSYAMFRLARALEISDTPPVNNGRAVLSSNMSYAETDLVALGLRDEYQFDEGEDVPGPHTLVGFAVDSETNGRIVLVGDSDFATDGQIGAPPGNAQLFFGSLNWLTEFEERITFGFQPSAIAPPTIFISPSQLDQVTFFVIFLVPGLTLIFGAGVWMYRRRR